MIGRFVADFCCLEARLIIEVDGNQHGTDKAQVRDARRTELIEAHRFHVIRFSNHDVMRSMDSVLDTIFAVLTEPSPKIEQAEGPPPLTPPRKGEGMHHG